VSVTQVLYKNGLMNPACFRTEASLGLCYAVF